MASRPIYAWTCIALALALAAAGAAHAGDSQAGGPGTLSLLVENDSFFSPSDRDYTNGVELLWTTPPHDADEAVRLARHLPFFAPDGAVRSVYGIGQTIFTPQLLSAANPPPSQRPYAGFLYGKYGLVETGANQQDNLTIQVGVVGPLSLAENAQKFIHTLENLTRPLGWDTQLHNEPGLALIYEHSWKFAPFGGDAFDIAPHAGGAAGNVFDYVNAGATMRLGFHLPDDYAPTLIEPSAPGANALRRGLAAYIFAGFDERAVGRNLFLDGNTFESSRHVPKEILVRDAEIGAVVALDRFRLSLTHVYRSREFRGQPAPDQFTSINLSALL